MKATFHYISGDFDVFDLPDGEITAAKITRTEILEVENDGGKTFINLRNVEKIVTEQQ